jgi:transcriptional regulator with XRE-family HTH domain
MDTVSLCGMGRGAAGPPSEFSRLVAANIDRLRDEAGLSHSALGDAAGLSRSYFHSRMKLELPFNTNDLDRVARALGVPPASLIAQPEVGDAPHRARVDTKVLQSRLMRLTHASQDADDLLERLSHIAIDHAEVDQAVLDPSEPFALISKKWLEDLASHFGVPASYLIDSTVDEASDLVDAQLELRDAMERVGAHSIHARALGEASPATLRAIARSLLATELPAER